MRFALLTALAVVLLSACQDPAGVGLGLIDETGADPSVVSLPPATAAAYAGTTPAAGFAATSGTTQPQTRVLVGDVRDPLFGDVTAVGYVDANRPSVFPSGFDTATLTGARLSLRRTYVYGDTTTRLPVEIRQVQGTWSPTDVSTDTLFSTGARLATATVVPADTILTIALPASWVTQNSDVLRGTSFADAFEGFELRVGTPGGGAGAVYGFDVTSAKSGLFVTTATDTVRYPINEVFSSLRRQPPTLPAAVASVRGGRGDGLALTFGTSTVGATPLARADLRFGVDRQYQRSGAFLRPLAKSALLYGVPPGSNGDRVQLAEVAIGADGRARVATPFILTVALQDVLLGRRSYERYELTLPVRPTATLDILPIVLDPGGADPLRLALTVVGAPG